jgi:hypothetical protein
MARQGRREIFLLFQRLATCNPREWVTFVIIVDASNALKVTVCFIFTLNFFIIRRDRLPTAEEAGKDR